MDKNERQFFLEDLVGSQILSPDNQRVGHVVDVQVAPQADFRVTGLLYGPYGWLHRLRVLEPLMRRLGMHTRVHVIPWRSVERFERFTVTLKPGWETEDEALKPMGRDILT
jgi:sporulation protein YlmC with PRC-barrel domain